MKTQTMFPVLMAFLLVAVNEILCQNVTNNIVPTKPEYEKYSLALEAIFGMGIRLQVLLDSEDGQNAKNFVVSPISATTIIGQLLLGAEGEFRDHLYELLSLPKTEKTQYYSVHHYNKNRNNETLGIVPYANFHLQLSTLLKALEQNKISRRFTLNQSSALFYDKDLSLKRRFQKHLAVFYETEIVPTEFSSGSVDQINKWAFDHTNGLISDVLSSPPDDKTASIFLNAIYFMAEWETPFSDMLNTQGNFSITASKTVETTYMLGFLESILYAESPQLRIVALPYKNRELSMFIILPNGDNPDRYDIRQFAENLNPKEVLELISKAKLRDVVVKIPKLSLSNTVSILKPLQKYAEYKKRERTQTDNKTDAVVRLMKKIENFKNFTGGNQKEIYLTAAADNGGLKVSDIVQQMVFSINEKGTEAAAVSLAVVDYIGGSKNFVLDRPFVFFIRHEATLATLFWGTISDPSQR